MESSNVWKAAVAAILVWAASFLCRVIYRLYFSPLAKFPGPSLAAATYLPELYYDIFKGEGGQFPQTIRRWHEQYGPIVRINPEELHIKDSAWFDTCYSGSRPAWKLHAVLDTLGMEKTTSAARAPDRWQTKRRGIAPFFSRKNIAMYGPRMQENMSKVVSRIQQEYVGTGKVLHINHMWECFATDNIMSYAFDQHHDFINSPDFRSSISEGFDAMTETSNLMKHLTFIPKLVEALPLRFVGWLNPAFLPLFQVKEDLRVKIADVLSAHDPDMKQSETVFSSLLHENLPPEELTHDAMHQEAMSVVGAAVETVTRTFTLFCFHVLSEPQIRSRLLAELREAIPDPSQMPSWDALTKLPYFSACIEETLRLTYGLSQRRTRAYDMPLPFHDWEIPPRTWIGMDNFDVSHDESIFPDSYIFNPDRWLGNPLAPDGSRLSRYMVTFGKGTRSCTGMYLAYAELYIGLANFFRSDLGSRAVLSDGVTKKDVEMARDTMVPRPSKRSKGVTVVFPREMAGVKNFA